MVALPFLGQTLQQFHRIKYILTQQHKGGGHVLGRALLCLVSQATQLSPSLTPPLVCPMGLPRAAMFSHPTHLHIVASNQRCSSRSSGASGGMSAKPRAAWRGWARGSTSAMSAQCRRTASSRTHEWHARRLELRLRRPRETLNDFDQLLVRSAPWVAKLIDCMFVREPAQTQQLAGALAPVQLQL